MLGPEFVADEIMKHGAIVSKEALRNVGMIGRSLDQMYREFLVRQEEPINAVFEIYANYYEIYNEQIYDLLSPHTIKEQQDKKELRPKLMPVKSKNRQ